MFSPVSPILVLDSGLGGLTVVRELQKLLPMEDILYFGDTARMPYGNKGESTVTGFLRQILNYFQAYRPKHVLVACNTATAVALSTIKAEFSHLSISGVIEPGARAAVDAGGGKTMPTFAVIATEATIRSKAYEKAIFRRRHHCQLLSRPTPLLAPVIEDGRTDRDPVVRVLLSQYLKPLIRRQPDVLVLGCTHYPVYKRLITKAMGESCRVIDSAEQSAQDVARRLAVSKLSRLDRHVGQLTCFVTDDPAKFQTLAPRFVGMEIDPPTLLPLDDLTAGVLPFTVRRAG